MMENVRRILEISVESVDAALAAEHGGAQRIELCSNAVQGGTTPGAELLRAARERVHLPIFAMIRPRGGDFFYSADEFATMQNPIGASMFNARSNSWSARHPCRSHFIAPLMMPRICASLSKM
jgi:CutC family protein